MDNGNPIIRHRHHIRPKVETGKYMGDLTQDQLNDGVTWSRKDRTDSTGARSDAPTPPPLTAPPLTQSRAKLLNLS